MAITASLIAPITASTPLGGFDVPSLSYNDIDSATYKIGALLTPSAGAELTEATSGTSGSSPTTGILGVALQAASNLATAPEYPNYGNTYPTGVASTGATAVTPLLFVPALPSLVFEGTLASNGADYAVAADGANLYVKYGLTKDTASGYWYVDVNSTTTNASCLVIGIKNVQDVVLGTTKGVRVYFVFLQDATLFTTQA